VRSVAVAEPVIRQKEVKIRNAARKEMQEDLWLNCQRAIDGVDIIKGEFYELDLRYKYINNGTVRVVEHSPLTTFSDCDIGVNYSPLPLPKAFLPRWFVHFVLKNFTLQRSFYFKELGKDMKGKIYITNPSGEENYLNPSVSSFLFDELESFNVHELLRVFDVPDELVTTMFSFSEAFSTALELTEVRIGGIEGQFLPSILGMDDREYCILRSYFNCEFWTNSMLAYFILKDQPNRLVVNEVCISREYAADMISATASRILKRIPVRPTARRIIEEITSWLEDWKTERAFSLI